MRASDLETGIITATAAARGPTGQPGQLVSKLYRRLTGDLDRRLPELAPDQIDEAPLANLHFMKGLGHYHSARYSHALAEFMLAAEDEQLAAVSRLWLANAYLAQRQYAHAYLELSRLKRGGSSNLRENEIAAKMRECRGIVREPCPGHPSTQTERAIPVLRGPYRYGARAEPRAKARRAHHPRRARAVDLQACVASCRRARGAAFRGPRLGS
jgi:hypothetical protein